RWRRLAVYVTIHHSPRHEHRHDRLLPPGLLAGRANGAAHGLLDEIQVLSPHTGYRLNRANRRIGHDVVQQCARPVGLGDADRDQIDVAGYVVPVVEDDVHGNMPGEGQSAPVAYAHLLVRADQLAVLVDAAERHLVDDLGFARRELQHVTVA